MTLFDRLKNLFNPTQSYPSDQEKNKTGLRLSAETDAGWHLGSRSINQTDRDRYDYDRSETLQQALEAWRVNPLARRIVELTSQYVVGGGISITIKHEKTARFVQRFWNHRLNQMPVKLYEWCDELTRSGNLFVLLSTDHGGMSYVRLVPAQDIETIVSRANDIEQPLLFYPKRTLENPDPKPYPAYDPNNDGPNADGSFTSVMLHYAVNRPAGAQWGESDLAPLLRWLARYSNWLEDRARLNRFRTSFLYVVTGKFLSEADRAARQQTLNAFPPTPGSILVCDESEKWEIISAKLDSQDANTDGLALKKMISAGSGIPLHFLAEPESATRTTAEAAGGPTYRRYEQRQHFFTWMIQDLLGVVIRRKSMVSKGYPIPSDGGASDTASILVQGADISARDNVSLSLSAANIANVLRDLRDRSLIDDAEMLRLIYRFAGETVDIESILKAGQSAPPPTFYHSPVVTNFTPAGRTDPVSGEEKQTP